MRLGTKRKRNGKRAHLKKTMANVVQMYTEAVSHVSLSSSANGRNRLTAQRLNLRHGKSLKERPKLSAVRPDYHTQRQGQEK